MISLLSNTMVYATLVLNMSNSIAPMDSSEYWVKSVGSRQAIMSNNLSGKFNLGTLNNIKHIYALGPISQLRGEITIYDSQVSLATVAKNSPQIKTKLSGEAIFLLYARSPSWLALPIEKQLTGLDEIESYVAAQAKKNNLSLEKTFPYRIEGNAEKMKYHIIFKDNQMKHSMKEHQKAKKMFYLEQAPVKILGFWVQPEWVGKLTHPGKRTHMHMQDEKNSVSGHVDHVVIPKGLTLYLPRINEAH